MEKITKSTDTVLIDPNEPLILPDGTALVGRIEWLLYALCCLDYQNLPTPMSRIEEFANALITGEIPNIEPQSRAEQFFLAILDGNISDLPQPQSRSEVLLDKLARGEFDLSDVEPIQSSYELLLAYLIKNGGIGNIDYVLYEFSEAMKTMYNTVEKPFKSLELSGNTLVNCVLEDTENDDYTSFDKDYSGTSFTINGTSEGAIKSAILTGQTLVNMCDDGVADASDITRFTHNYASGSGTFEQVSDGIKATTTQDNTYLIVGYDIRSQQRNTMTIGKKYYGVADVTVHQLTNSESCQIVFRTAYGLRASSALTNGRGLVQSVFTHSSVDANNGWLAVGTNSQKAVVGDSFTVHSMSVYEITEDETNLSYEELANKYPVKCVGMQSVKMPVLTTTGKNLFNGYNEFIKVNHSEKLYLSSSDTTGATRILLTAYDENKNLITSQSAISSNNAFYHREVDNKWMLASNKSQLNIQLTLSDDVKYVVFETLNGLYMEYENIQLEESSVATSYEPHKTNILTVNEDVTLRGIGDVQDTLDCLTGEVTQRIGEIVLDGREEWNLGNQGDGTTTITFTTPILNAKSHVTIISDLFNYNQNSTNGIEGVAIGLNVVFIQIARNKLTSLDSNGVKKWLQQNPITLQYQLAKESIKTVDLNVVDQNNTKIDKIHVFDEVTHVNASSDELTPTVNISKSVSYPTIIKPNTKYTVDLKRNDRPLTINLGGTEVTFVDGETRKTITTPSTLTNDKLSYYGVGAKCNEIMLIEGEVEGNIDYFTGMQSVVMQNQIPVLTTSNQRFTILPYEIFENSTPINYQGFTRIDFGLTLTDVMCYIKLNNDMQIKMLIDGFEEVNSNSGISKGVEYSKKLNNISYIGFYNWGDIKHGDGKETILSMLKNGELEIVFSKEGEKKYPHYSNNTKTSILSYSDDVTLHGIENIQDTLDCLTGEVVERIGEIVLDGSEGRWDLAQDRANTMRFNCFNLDIPIGVNGSLLKTDKFPYQSPTANDQEGAVMGGGVVTPRVPSISILKTRLPSNDIDGFKQWLSQNPITVQYRLATESIKIVDLDVVDQDGNAIPKIKSYKDVTHLEVTVPKQSLLPHISAEVATDNSKDMSLLTTKHQEISEAQSVVQNSIQSQSDEIDTAMIATTEIFESILE